jgi:hypothetical protein
MSTDDRLSDRDGREAADGGAEPNVRFLDGSTDRPMAEVGRNRFELIASSDQ